MIHNSLQPDITVDAQTYEVRIDGEHYQRAGRRAADGATLLFILRSRHAAINATG